MEGLCFRVHRKLEIGEKTSGRKMTECIHFDRRGFKVSGGNIHLHRINWIYCESNRVWYYILDQ